MDEPIPPTTSPTTTEQQKPTRTKSQTNGDNSEKEVVNLIPCYFCGKELMRLPNNYPLADVQCTACIFRAQVKFSSKSPRNTIRGAGWDILDKVLKAGYMIPPTYFNHKWIDKKTKQEHQEIRFYPALTRKNIKMGQLSPTAKRARYKMVNYINLNHEPFKVVYKK